MSASAPETRLSAWATSVACQLGDVEPLAGAAEIAAQPVEVVARVGEDVAGAHDRRVGLDDVLQDGLFGVRQACPRRQHLVLGAPRPGHGLAAAVERLLGHQAALGLLQDVGVAVVLVVATGPVDVVLGLPVEGQAAGGADQRPPAGQGLRHQLVGGAQPGALGIEAWVVDIGGPQGVAQGLARGRSVEAAGQDQAGQPRQQDVSHGHGL